MKPPLPVTVMVELLEAPWKIVRLPGLAERMKSGGATITRSLAWRLIAPLVPFTLIRYWPIVVVELAETVKMALAVGVAVESEMLVGLSVTVGGWVLLELGTEKPRLMSPVKPLRPAKSSLKLVTSPPCRTPDESDEASSE